MGEKKMDAAAQELHAFTEQPDLTPAEQAEADSYTASLQEQLDELKAGGIPVPEREGGAKLDLPDAFGGIEQGFSTAADLTPEAQLEADSYTESAAEIREKMRADGLPVPEKKPGVKPDLPDAFGGIEQGFNTETDLTPEAQLEADSYTESAAEIREEMHADGLPVPEKKPGVKLDLPDAFGGIEQGFNTEADLTPEAQLEADSFVDSPAEQMEDIKKLLNKK